MAAFHVKRPARPSWHLISWFAAGDNDGAPALTGPGFTREGKPAGRGEATGRAGGRRGEDSVSAGRSASTRSKPVASPSRLRIWGASGCSAEPSRYDHRAKAL